MVCSVVLGYRFVKAWRLYLVSMVAMEITHCGYHGDKLRYAVSPVHNHVALFHQSIIFVVVLVCTNWEAQAKKVPPVAVHIADALQLSHSQAMAHAKVPEPDIHSLAGQNGSCDDGQNGSCDAEKSSIIPSTFADVLV